MKTLNLKTEKEPLDLSYKSDDLYNEEYHRTHTFGLEDKFYKACGAEKRLTPWKKLEKSRFLLWFDYEAFLKGPGVYIRRGMNALGIISYLLHAAMFLAAAVLAVGMDTDTEQMRYFQSLEKPKYTYAEACALKESYTKEYNDYVLYIMENRDDIAAYARLQQMQEEYEVVKSSREYLEACRLAEEARKYEAAERRAEDSRIPVFDVKIYILWFRAAITVRCVFALFSDRLYLRKVRNDILKAMAYSDNDPQKAEKMLAGSEAVRQSAYGGTKIYVKVLGLIFTFAAVTFVTMIIRYSI